MIRIPFALFALFAFAACTPASARVQNFDALPENIRDNARAIELRQTSDAARLNAERAQLAATEAARQQKAVEGKLTAVAQSTRDTLSMEGTRVAIYATATAVVADAHATAQQRANAQTTTADANERRGTATARADSANATATRAAALATSDSRQATATIQAIHADRTAVAAQVTASAIAINAAVQATRTANELVREAERMKIESAIGGFATGAWTVIGVSIPLVIIGLVVYAVVRIVSAVELRQRTIRDERNGNVIAFILPPSMPGDAPRVHILDPRLLPPPMPEMVDAEPRAVIPFTSAGDYAAAPVPAPAPKEDLIREFIHRTDLAVFIRAILERDDWSEGTWAGKQLPRGFVLSTDTRDENRRVVVGGYRRLMQLFVERRVIVGRRRGASGRWNPHVPRDVNAVLNVLSGAAPLPELPAEVVSPYPIRADAA